MGVKCKKRCLIAEEQLRRKDELIKQLIFDKKMDKLLAENKTSIENKKDKIKDK